MFHAYLIIHKDPKIRKDYITGFLQQFKIHSVDMMTYQDPSITIAHIRAFKAWLSRKPYLSGYKAAVFSGDNLTREAGQAMLKILEEPPPQTLIILESVNSDTILPTIESRCNVVNILPTPSILTENDTREQIKFWKNILQSKVGERLKHSQSIISDREHFKFWLEKQIIFFRFLLLKFYQHSDQPKDFSLPKIFCILKNLIIADRLNENNISLKLNADHLFLNCQGLHFHV